VSAPAPLEPAARRSLSAEQPAGEPAEEERSGEGWARNPRPAAPVMPSPTTVEPEARERAGRGREMRVPAGTPPGWVEPEGSVVAEVVRPKTAPVSPGSARPPVATRLP